MAALLLGHHGIACCTMEQPRRAAVILQNTSGFFRENDRMTAIPRMSRRPIQAPLGSWTRCSALTDKGAISNMLDHAREPLLVAARRRNVAVTGAHPDRDGHPPWSAAEHVRSTTRPHLAARLPRMRLPARAFGTSLDILHVERRAARSPRELRV